MKIHSLTTLIAFPFLVLAGWILYMMLGGSADFNTAWLLAPVMILSLLFVFKMQIDQWWWSKSKPELPKQMLEWLLQYSEYFTTLSTIEQERFSLKLARFLLTKEFYIVGEDAKQVPYDIKAIASHEAVKLMMHTDDNIFRKVQKIVLYKHAFPSPVHQVLHTVEFFEADGVLIFSLEHLVPGLIDTPSYYNISMHGYIEAMVGLNPAILSIDTEKVSWDQLEEISNKSISFIHDTVGLEDISKATVILNHYFTYREMFAQVLPELILELDSKFVSI